MSNHAECLSHDRVTKHPDPEHISSELIRALLFQGKVIYSFHSPTGCTSSCIAAIPSSEAISQDWAILVAGANAQFLSQN